MPEIPDYETFLKEAFSEEEKHTTKNELTDTEILEKYAPYIEADRRRLKGG